MSVLVIPIYLLVFCIFWILNTNSFRKRLNYSNVFLLLWCIIPSISSIGLYGFYTPPIEAHIYILLAIIVFETTTLFAKRFRVVRKNKIQMLSDTERVGWNLLLIISIVCFITIMSFFIVSIRYALSNSFYYLRIRILNNELFSARSRTMLQDIIQPLIIVTTLASVYHLVEKGKPRIVAVISIINCILYMLTIGNRWLIMEVMFIIIAVVIGKYGLNVIAILKSNKWISRIAVVLLLGLIFITVQRSIRGSTGLLYDVYAYFVGSVHLFGLAIKSPDVFQLGSSHYLWGQELISALIGLINNIGAAFGKGELFQSGIGAVNEITQKYYFVSPTTHMNNNVTMIYGFMRDCGVVGIIIDTALLALFCVILYKKRNQSIYRKLMYIFNISLLPFLIFEWFYARTFVLIVFIILALLDKFCTVKLKLKHK